MSNFFTTEKGLHFYTQDGQPLYTVLKKDGKPRNTTPADARKMGLVPSVTGVIDVIAKPELVNWLQNRAVKAAIAMERNEGESDEQFGRRIVADIKEQGAKAPDIGTAFHRFAEDYLSARNKARDTFTCPEGIPRESVVGWIRWVWDNFDILYEDYPRLRPNNPAVGYSEVSIASSLGYGGKMDWVGRMANGLWAVVDWKTQNVTSEPKFYDTYDLQLAAYANAIQEFKWSLRFGIPEIDKRISFVISTNPDNPGVWVKEWDNHDKAFEAFKAALAIWKWQKNYDPSDVVVEEKQEVMA